MKKTTGITLVVIALMVIGIFLFSNSRVSAYEQVSTYEGEMKIYKSSSCGCCNIYSSYYSNKGNSDVEIITQQTIDDVKEKYGVPESMLSCHTTIIGDYFVEGHVPLEAIEKLLEEKPDIAGIAMPGMPLGSPGMPGAKEGDFIIYSIDYEGNIEEFMRI